MLLLRILRSLAEPADKWILQAQASQRLIFEVDIEVEVEVEIFVQKIRFFDKSRDFP